MGSEKEKLAELRNRLQEIEPTLAKTFKTSEELNLHIEKNKNLYKEGKELYEQIQQLEYELMSPKEREEYDEYRRLSKLKAEGKLEL